MRDLGLTPRERAVARCTLEGWGEVRTAQQLKVTRGAVKNLAKRACDKMGQDSRLRLIVFLLWNPWALAQVMECEYHEGC